VETEVVQPPQDLAPVAVEPAGGQAADVLQQQGARPCLLD
jgi:hypothetical protein